MLDYGKPKKILILVTPCWKEVTEQAFRNVDSTAQLEFTNSLKEFKRKFGTKKYQGAILPFKPICDDQGYGQGRIDLQTELSKESPQTHIVWAISYLEPPENPKDVIYQPFTIEQLKNFLLDCPRPLKEPEEPKPR